MPINVKFILLTENVSFLPENILNNSLIINIPRPSKNALKKTFNKIATNDVANLKELHNPDKTEAPSYYALYDDIIAIIKNPDNVKYSMIR